MQVLLMQILFIFGVSFFANLTQAATYYVSTTGKDDGNEIGSFTAPFKTIAKGSRKLAPGDTLYMRGGTYSESMIHGAYGFTFKNGISKSAMTRFMPFQNEKVIVKPPVRAAGEANFVVWFSRNTQYVEILNLVLDGTNITYLGKQALTSIAHAVVKMDASYEQNLGAKNNRIINNEIRFGGVGIQGGGDNEIIGNKIHHNRVYGIYTSFDNGLIEGNLIYDNAGCGLHLFQQNHAVNGWVVRNNRFYGNGDNYYPKYSPYFGVNKRPVPAVVLARGKNQFYNNLVYNNVNGGVSVFGNADNTLVANNTIYGNGKYGISVADTVNNARIINNIISNNGSVIIDSGVGTIMPKNNLITDPGLVNAAAGDFRLKAGSPAINKGATLTEVLFDFTKSLRPAGAYDIGAYEYGAAKAVTLSAPTNLRVND